jgi:hypothetical protein
LRSVRTCWRNPRTPTLCENFEIGVGVMLWYPTIVSCFPRRKKDPPMVNRLPCTRHGMWAAYCEEDARALPLLNEAILAINTFRDSGAAVPGGAAP